MDIKKKEKGRGGKYLSAVSIFPLGLTNFPSLINEINNRKKKKKMTKKKKKRERERWNYYRQNTKTRSRGNCLSLFFTSTRPLPPISNAETIFGR